MTNTIIRASAGSGKTFRLSNIFLNALFQSCESGRSESIGAVLDSILAATFTRKAAGEITDRIFTKFADAALDPQKRKQLAEFLEYPKSKNLDKQLQNLLADLARNMYRLRVGTLDAFFNKIATAFTLELGLPPGWSMLDDSEYPRLLTEAVRDVFNESRRNDAKELMRLLQRGEENPGMMKELVGLAQTILPLVRTTKKEHWEHETPQRLEKHTHDLLSDDRIDALVKRINAVSDGMLPQTGNKTPHSDYVSARNKIESAMQSQDWKTFINITLVKAVAPALAEPGAKCEYSRKDVCKEAPELFEIVRTILPHAKSMQIKILIGQTRATYALLKMVAEKLDIIMERERKFRFEDITRKIADYGFNNRLDALRHRLNAETKHLLLDEFQDTSLAQWEILEPLALQTVNDVTGTYFCVGDEKQSIYSWRGGEAAIFGSMKARLEKGLTHQQIDVETMEETRRCAEPIIETVNTLFGNIQNSITVGKVSKKAGNQWQKRFKEHSTGNNNPGYCILEESPEKAHIDYVTDRIAQMIPIVQNRPELKEGIGVLVATGDFGAKIVSALKERGIEIAGNGATLLQSPAVRYVISALVFAEHPGDSIARFHAANSPLAEMIGFKEHKDHYCSRKIRETLIEQGYGKVISGYIEVLSKFCDAVELERLEKLREVAYRFDTVTTGVRTYRFVEMLEKERVSNQNAARVHVMTIHAAKGLEFDIVVLPQLDRNLQGRTSGVTCVAGNEIADDSTSPINFVLRYADAGLQSVLPKEYQEVFERRIQGEAEESLCELYVAMTRAIQSLIMIVPHRKNKSYSTSFENVLRELPQTSMPYSNNVLYEKGVPNWYVDIPETKTGSPAAAFDELECNLNKAKVVHHVPRITPSTLHTGEKSKSHVQKEKSSPLPEDAALKGTAIHACFERSVEWLDDPHNNNEIELRELIADVLQNRPAAFSADDILAEFRSACRQPEILAALSRSRYLPDDNPELERERRFAIWKEGKIMRGSIDRLVIQQDSAGTITNIEILDYKTGGAMDEIGELAKYYRTQMDAYRQAVIELYNVDAAIVAMTLVFVTLGKTVTVVPS